MHNWQRLRGHIFSAIRVLTALVAGMILRAAQAGEIITGSGESTVGGMVPNIKVFDGATSAELKSFLPFGAGATNGVRVAAGDVNHDGTPDYIAGLGNSGGTPAQVKVFSGTTLAELRSFLPYGAGFTGGVYVAAGDVNGDGVADIVTGAGDLGNTQVNVFSGVDNSLLKSFLAYSGFSGGVRVAAGDVNGDGFADIITGIAAGATPHVKAFDAKTGAEIRSFFAFDPAFSGGVYVAAGDLDGDGKADIVTGAGQAGGTQVKAFSGADGSLIRSFLAYTGSSDEVRVAVGDVNNDGRNDIITGLGGTTPQVKAFDGSTLALLDSFLAYDPGFTGGVYVGAVAVPEPTTLLLAVLGIAALVAFRWRASGTAR